MICPDMTNHRRICAVQIDRDKPVRVQCIRGHTPSVTQKWKFCQHLLTFKLFKTCMSSFLFCWTQNRIFWKTSATKLLTIAIVWNKNTMESNGYHQPGLPTFFKIKKLIHANLYLRQIYCICYYKYAYDFHLGDLMIRHLINDSCMSYCDSTSGRCVTLFAHQQPALSIKPGRIWFLSLI